MKLASFLTGAGPGFGVVEGDSILRLDRQGGDLKSWLVTENRISDITLRGARRLVLADVALLPPIPNPGKIFCVATNFHEPERQGKPAPEFPLMFTRCAEAQVGHGAAVLKPAVSEKFDFEGELAVIIGTPGHKIPRAQAMAHVGGYACFNDGSVRDWQKHSTQFTPGKNFFQSGGFGPWLVTPDEVPDPCILRLETRVNGVVKQAISMGQMIFDIPWLIAYCSTFTPLAPGDVIVTGTPSGFGATRTPPEFLCPGDVVEVEIPGIGLLRNTVVQDDDPRAPHNFETM